MYYKYVLYIYVYLNILYILFSVYVKIYTGWIWIRVRYGVNQFESSPQKSSNVFFFQDKLNVFRVCCVFKQHKDTISDLDQVGCITLVFQIPLEVRCFRYVF